MDNPLGANSYFCLQIFLLGSGYINEATVKGVQNYVPIILVTILPNIWSILLNTSKTLRIFWFISLNSEYLRFTERLIFLLNIG